MTIMKKYSFILSAAFVLFALASCQKEVEINVEKVTPEVEQTGSIPFQFVGSVDGEDATGTKTTLNTSTWAVSWDSTDKVYAVATDATNETNPNWGSGTSSSDSGGLKVAEFSYSAGVFSTDTEITDGEHTFNFIYANAAQKKYHRATGTSHQLYSSQSVDASNPAGNLKNYDAMVGTKTITTPASLATVDFKHIYSLMKVTIANSTGAALTATKFKITFAGANIAGVFNISNFSTGAIALASGGTSTIEVPITNGAIANSSSIDIYFAIAPLTDFTGDVTFTVSDANDQVYSRTNTISSAKSFEAGKYNTATFVLSSGIKQATTRFERITNLDNLVTGDYLILGTKEADANYGFMRYASMNSNRIPYTQDYDSEASIPSVRNVANPDAIWHLGVSGSGDSRTVTIYNTENDRYLKCDGSGNLSWVNALAGANTNYTVTSVSDSYSFAGAKNTLNINSASDWWKCYAASGTNTTSGIILYQNWETSTLSSIALEGTYPTSFNVGDSFSYDGLKVKATYENGKSRYVTPVSVLEAGASPDLSSARAGVTITVTYTESAVTKTATYTIDVVSASNYTVSWISNGSAYGDPNVVVGGGSITLPAVNPTMAGNTFIGWTSATSVNADGSAITYAKTGDEVTGDITYYAVFAVAGSPVSETLNIGTYASDNKWDDGAKQSGATVGSVTFTATSSSGNDSKYYNTASSWRFYNADTGVRIATPSGTIITSVEVTFTNDGCKIASGWTPSSADTSSSPATFEPLGGTVTNTVDVLRSGTGSGHVRFQVFEVNYTPVSGFKLTN